MKTVAGDRFIRNIPRDSSLFASGLVLASFSACESDEHDMNIGATVFSRGVVG